MHIKFKAILILILAGALPFFPGCNGDSSNSGSDNNAQPGTQAQQCAPVSNDAATIKKCDDKRKELRKVALEFLGINALQIASDKILKEISRDDLEKIVKDTTENNEKNLSEISGIIKTATIAAGLDPNSNDVIAGSSPTRVIHIGYPDFLDPRGNFSVGSARLQENVSAVKVGDIYEVILAVGLNTDPSKSFQSYQIGLERIVSTTDEQTITDPLSEYVENQLPCFCQGTNSQLDFGAFNTIEVGASAQPASR